MFQPQPTPYSSFAAYGISAGLPHYAYQPDQIPSSSAAAGTGLNSGGGGWLGLEGAATTGGATASAPSEPSLPIYTPPTFNPGAGPGAFPPFNNSNNPTPPLQGNVKMESNMTDDLAAQEAAARDYQPEPQVRIANSSLLHFSPHSHPALSCYSPLLSPFDRHLPLPNRTPRPRENLRHTANLSLSLFFRGLLSAPKHQATSLPRNTPKPTPYT